MNIITGDMWSAFDGTDHFIFTGNVYVKKSGALVMGRGIARVVRDRFKGIDVMLGKAVMANKGSDEFYGLILGSKIGVFQVKYFWGDDADPRLIRRSADMLAMEANHNPEHRYDMNFPGIGNGKLAYDAVLPLLEKLPDNVNVWKFK